MQQLYLRRWQTFVLQIGWPIADPVGADGRSEAGKCLRPAGVCHPIGCLISIPTTMLSICVAGSLKGGQRFSPSAGRKNGGLPGGFGLGVRNNFLPVAEPLGRLCRRLWIKVDRDGAITKKLPPVPLYPHHQRGRIPRRRHHR